METTINKLKENYGKSYIWVFLFTALTFIKMFIVQGFMEANGISLWYLVINFFLIFGIYTFLLVLPDGWRMPGLFITYGILSILVFANLVHFRYFGGPISVYSIYSAGYLGAVGDSIQSLFSVKDLLVFIDIPILLFIFWSKKIVIKSKLRDERILAFLTSIMLIFSISFVNGLNVDKSTYSMNQLGLLNYHLHDISQFFKEDNIEVVNVGEYFDKKNQNRKNIEDLNAYGIGEGRNLFVIQVEALQNFVINREIEGKPITPVINSLISKDSFYFDKYFQQLGRGNTSDAEFVSHNSLYPSMRSYSYNEYEGIEFYNLPNALKEQGYSTIAFHGNEPDFWNRKDAYPAQGLDTFISEDELNQDEIIGLGISDGSTFRQSIDYYKEMNQPFYSFFVTLTSHHPFTIPEELKTLSLEGEYKGTMLGNYMESINYFDTMLGDFIEDLKEADLYENSVIALYGDHFGVNIQDIQGEETREDTSKFLGREYNYEDAMNVSLIVHVPGSGVQETISVAGGQIDFFPTMLNIMGIEPEHNYFMGQDLLNAEEGFVLQEQNLMPRGSFMTNEIVFEMSKDGRFENSRAWKMYTGEPVDLGQIKDLYERSKQEISVSNYIADSYLNESDIKEVDWSKEIIFSDIVNHELEEAIEYMVEKGIVSGKSDGRFYPNDPVQKVEFLKMLLSTLEIDVDTNTAGAWWAPYVNTAMEMNIITNDSVKDSTHEDDILKEDALKWAEKALAVSGYSNFNIDHLIEELSLNSEEKLTRALSAEILYSIIK